MEKRKGGGGRRGHWAAKDGGRGRDRVRERSGGFRYLCASVGLLWMTRLALLLADLANDGSDCFHIHPHASVNQILASDLSTLSTVPSPCERESERARARASARERVDKLIMRGVEELEETFAAVLL